MPFKAAALLLLPYHKHGLLQFCSISKVPLVREDFQSMKTSQRQAKYPHTHFASIPFAFAVAPEAKSDSCGVRTHALSEWRLEPPP